MSRLLISVVLPVFNAENTLERAILSVLAQQDVAFELLIVDNGSQDATTEILSKYVDNERVKVLSESNRGVVYAMNRGIEEAQGNWVARMDADDEWFPDKLAKQWAYIRPNPEVQVLATRVEYATEHRENTGLEHYVQWSNSCLTSLELNQSVFVEQPVVNPSLLIDRSVFTQFGLYRDGSFPEDYEMVLRWHKHGVEIHKLPEVLMRWWDYPTRLTRTNSNYSKQAFNQIKCKYLANWLKLHNPLHPEIWVWGASRKMRRKAEVLENHGITISGYVDIKAHKTTTKPCVHFTQLPHFADRFIVSFAGMRGARDDIRAILKQKGYRELQDFVIAA